MWACPDSRLAAQGGCVWTGGAADGHGPFGCGCAFAWHDVAFVLM